MKLVILLVFVSALSFVFASSGSSSRADGDSVPAGGHHYPQHHHHPHHHGRVQIKTYRGASKQHGWGWFAPYGYWVRQPADGWGGWGWSG